MGIWFKRKMIVLKILKRELFASAEDIVCYVCGNKALPQPLEPEEEQVLLEEIQSGNLSARDKLVEHNLRLVVFIAKKFESTGYDEDDLISVGAIGLIKAINSFKGEKNIPNST